MTVDQYKSVRDSLISNDKIHYAEGRYYTYKFILQDEDKASVRFSPYFDNDFLASFDLKFGHYRSTYNFNSNGNNFDNFEETKDIQNVIQLYTRKH